MKLLVAGSSGQVARALAERAARDGVEAITIGRPELDLSAPETLGLALDAHPSDVVVNAAAYTAVDQAESDEAAAARVNAAGAGALSAAAAARGLPVIHLSTDYVFDGSKPTPYIEDDPVAPLGAYGRTKLAGERAVAAANPQHVILRTAWVYSPFGRNFVKTMLRLAETREAVGVVSDQFGAPTNALDLADGVIAVAKRLLADGDGAPFGCFHLTGGGEAVWADLAETVFETSAAADGPVARVDRITTAEFPTPTTRPANSRLDCRKIETAYGIALPHWRQSAIACTRRILEERSWRA